jgi:BarA-like signal transduction histidine kinase
MEIEIRNITVKSVIKFTDEKIYLLMQEGIKNCINKPLEYPLIIYTGADEVTIFTAEYLKQSLISWKI